MTTLTRNLNCHIKPILNVSVTWNFHVYVINSIPDFFGFVSDLLQGEEFTLEVNGEKVKARIEYAGNYIASTDTYDLVSTGKTRLEAFKGLVESIAEQI
jgi:hypothetical protein